MITANSLANKSISETLPISLIIEVADKKSGKFFDSHLYQYPLQSLLNYFF